MLSQYKNWALTLPVMANAIDTEIGTNENAVQKLSLLCRSSRRQLFIMGSISEKFEMFYK